MLFRSAHVRHALDQGESLPVHTLVPQPAPSAPSAKPLSLREISGRAAQDAERSAILAALQASGGNKSEAARRLRTDTKTLYVKIRQYGLR